MARRFAVILAACGGGAAAHDAPMIDAPAACTATWSGNFAEVATSPTACATITPGGALAIQAPTTRLPTPLPIAIQLAAAVAGSYSSESVVTWSASEKTMVVGDTCIFQAGPGVAPPGDFTLTLADATAPHGTLDLDMVVLAGELSVCGNPLSEQLELAF